MQYIQYRGYGKVSKRHQAVIVKCTGACKPYTGVNVLLRAACKECPLRRKPNIPICLKKET